MRNRFGKVTQIALSDTRVEGEIAMMKVKDITDELAVLRAELRKLNTSIEILNGNPETRESVTMDLLHEKSEEMEKAIKRIEDTNVGL